MKDYTKELGFWKRLESFVSDVQTVCCAGEAEKEMIMRCCKLKILDLQNVSNHVKIATLKYENHNIDCLTFGKEYEILHKDNYTGGRIHIKNDNGDYRIYKISNFNCC